MKQKVKLKYEKKMRDVICYFLFVFITKFSSMTICFYKKNKK